MEARPVAHTCNPKLWEAWAGGSPEVRSSTHQPGQHDETPSLLKIQKISRAWWHTPVVPATQEADAWESLEPKRQRLQWAEVLPLHSSLGDRVRLCLKTKQYRITMRKQQGVTCKQIWKSGYLGADTSIWWIQKIRWHRSGREIWGSHIKPIFLRKLEWF